MGSDRVPDVVICGRGFDVVSVDRFDAAAEDCEVVRRALSVGSAPTPVAIEFLGWSSLALERAAPLPAPAVAPGGTLTACAQGDRRLDVYYRVRGLAQRTSIRVEFDFPTARDRVDFDSLRPREQGQDLIYSFAAATGAPGLSNGAYAIRFHVEASGVYTPAGEATVTRACP